MASCPKLFPKRLSGITKNKTTVKSFRDLQECCIVHKGMREMEGADLEIMEIEMINCFLVIKKKISCKSHYACLQILRLLAVHTIVVVDIRTSFGIQTQEIFKCNMTSTNMQSSLFFHTIYFTSYSILLFLFLTLLRKVTVVFGGQKCSFSSHDHFTWIVILLGSILHRIYSPAKYLLSLFFVLLAGSIGLACPLRS